MQATSLPKHVKVLSVCLAGFLTGYVAIPAAADAGFTKLYDRKLLAQEIHNFLRENARCFYDGQEWPCDWYDDAYAFHWTARELYSTKPLEQIKMPVSDCCKGAFKSGLLVKAEHTWLLWRIGQVLEVK